MAAACGILLSVTGCGYTMPSMGDTGPMAVTVGVPLERDVVDYEDFTGAGAEMRRALGTAVFSGMLGVTFFGIFLTPVFYYVLQGLSEWWRPLHPARPAGTEDRRSDLAEN
jgi:hypothetical protein